MVVVALASFPSCACVYTSVSPVIEFSLRPEIAASPEVLDRSWHQTSNIFHIDSQVNDNTDAVWLRVLGIMSFFGGNLVFAPHVKDASLPRSCWSDQPWPAAGSAISFATVSLWPQGALLAPSHLLRPFFYGSCNIGPFHTTL
jgi:hypothetical protein